MQAQGVTEPVFWWWDEPEGARVVALTPTTLGLSSPLSKAQLASLEEARRRGSILDGDLGTDATAAALADVSSVRHVPEARQVVVTLVDGRTIVVAPPPAAGGVAAGVFGALHQVLAPGRDPVETVSIEEASPRTALWGLAALAVLFTLGTLVTPMSLIPAGLCVVAAGVLVLREDRTDGAVVGQRVVEIPLGPDPVEAAELDAATNFERPLLAPERTDEPQPPAAAADPAPAPEHPPIEQPAPATKQTPTDQPAPTTKQPPSRPSTPTTEHPPTDQPAPTTNQPPSRPSTPNEAARGPGVSPTYGAGAPRPAWATAPEPQVELATPAAVEASVEVTGDAPPEPRSEVAEADKAPDASMLDRSLEAPTAPWRVPPG